MPRERGVPFITQDGKSASAFDQPELWARTGRVPSPSIFNPSCGERESVCEKQTNHSQTTGEKWWPNALEAPIQKKTRHH